MGGQLGIFVSSRVYDMCGESLEFFQIPEPIWGELGIFPTPRAFI